MKSLVVLMLLYSTSAYAGKYDEDVKQCLKHWGKTPFNKNKLDYRVIKSSVSVFGKGGDIVDDTKTSKPQLVFLRASVNVLGKNVVQLNNPNGWYCMSSNTNVLGKAVIELNCKAKLAVSNTGQTVLAADDGKTPGTTVLGKTKIIRKGCDYNMKFKKK